MREIVCVLIGFAAGIITYHITWILWSDYKSKAPYRKKLQEENENYRIINEINRKG